MSKSLIKEIVLAFKGFCLSFIRSKDTTIPISKDMTRIVYTGRNPEIHNPFLAGPFPIFRVYKGALVKLKPGILQYIVTESFLDYLESYVMPL